jgi:hypothetical protein
MCHEVREYIPSTPTLIEWDKVGKVAAIRIYADYNTQNGAWPKGAL